MQNKNNSKTRYPLATAGKRIVAKAIDILLIAVIVMCLGFAIFCTDPHFVWNQPLVLLQNWRYGLFVSLVAIIFFGLMYLLPIFWKKTIGMKALKLFYFSKEKHHLAWGLFKHELFIWEIVVIIAFAMGWTLSGLNQLQIDSLFQGANAIWFNTVPDNLDKACFYVGTGFSVMYGICIVFLIAIIIATCIRSGRPAFHDKYSYLVVGYKQPSSELKSWSSKKNEDVQDSEKVPGQLSEESLEELDRI